MLAGSNNDDLATATGGSTNRLDPISYINVITSFIARCLSPQQPSPVITESSISNRIITVDADITHIQFD